MLPKELCYCKIVKPRDRKFRLTVDMYQICLPLAICQHMDFYKCIASTINYVIAWLLWHFKSYVSVGPLTKIGSIWLYPNFHLWLCLFLSCGLADATEHELLLHNYDEGFATQFGVCFRKTSKRHIWSCKWEEVTLLYWWSKYAPGKLKMIRS